MSVETEALLPAFSILKNNPRRVSYTYSEEFFIYCYLWFTWEIIESKN